MFNISICIILNIYPWWGESRFIVVHMKNNPIINKNKYVTRLNINPIINN